MVRTHPPPLRKVQSPSAIAAPRMVMAMSMFPALAADAIRFPMIPAQIELFPSRRTYLVP